MIGIFDSGSGGLTIMQALRARLPDHDFLYLGDHARAPYGTLDPSEILAFTRQAVDRLLTEGCRLVVIACNTAAAIALRPLQRDWLPMRAGDARLLGVHIPLLEAITELPWRPLPRSVETRPSRTVGIFATPATVSSGALVEEIRLRAPEVRVVQQACPGLVEAIERDDGERASELVDSAVRSLLAQPGGRDIRSVALACTHYPFARGRFRAALPRRIAIFEQPALVAESLDDYLSRHPGADRPGTGRLRLLTSGDTAIFSTAFARLAS